MYEIQDNQRKRKNKSKTLQRQAQNNVVMYLFMYVCKEAQQIQAERHSFDCLRGSPRSFFYIDYVRMKTNVEQTDPSCFMPFPSPIHAFLQAVLLPCDGMRFMHITLVSRIPDLPLPCPFVEILRNLETAALPRREYDLRRNNRYPTRF